MVSDNKNNTSLEPRYDADGKVWLKVTYKNDGVAKTPMRVLIDEGGYVALDLADAATYYYVGVPDKAYATGVEAFIQIGGKVEDMVTPSLSVSTGHALTIHDGAVADAGADYSGASAEFGCATADSTSSATQDVMLIPRIILATT